MRHTKNSPRRTLIRRLSKHGWIVEIPVNDDPKQDKAIVEMSVFGDLMSKGLYPILSVSNQGYVVAWSPVYRKWDRLARLIVNANSEQSVSMIDGDELNLITSNIQLNNPPTPKPITYSRDNFLSTEIGIFSDLVDWEWIHDVSPPTQIDENTKALAAYNKKMIDYANSKKGIK
jgi:hypothetical protein